MNLPTTPRLLRRTEPARIGGVAGGLGHYIGIDPIVFRVLFVILTFAGGSGLVLYCACWLLLPRASSSDPRPIAFTSSTPSLIAGLAILAIGALGLFDGDSWGFDAEIIVPIAIVFIGIRILNQRSEEASADATEFANASHGGWPSTAMPSPPADPRTAPSEQQGSAPPDHGELGEGSLFDEGPHAGVPWATASPEPGLLDDLAPLPTASSKRTGPSVTSITLAASAVVLGLFLVLSNVAGLSLTTATAIGALLAVVGAGLIASAVYERALALYPLGAILLLLLPGSTLVDTTVAGGVGSQDVRVDSLDALQSSYVMGMGELIVDLRGLTLTDEQGETRVDVEVDVGAGFAEVILPRGMRVEVVATSSAGYVDVLGRTDEGILNEIRHVSDGATPNAPTLRLFADVTFGYVEVSRG